jgi:hypothetical protein
MLERGADENEVIAAVQAGEIFPAKYGRTGFRRNFQVSGQWRGRHFNNKQIEAYAVEEDGWLVLTVIVKYF